MEVVQGELLSRRVIGDLGGSWGLGGLPRAQWRGAGGECAVFGMTFGKTWDLVNLSGRD